MMAVTRLQRRRRAAIAKVAIAGTLAVLVLTPRFDIGDDLGDGSAPGPTEVSVMATLIPSPTSG
jgi:hypothetical protein